LRRHVRAPVAAADCDRARRSAVRDRAHARPRAVAVRIDPGAGDPVRADRHVRPLAEAEGLFQELPAAPALELAASEGLRAIGAAAMSLFAARDIAIQFGGIKAVDNVSFDVAQGEVFAIIGPNGAGKTTIFNLISRIYNPTSGELTFNGQNI